jgi:immunity protein 51 of polymorphic toxin system
MSDEDITPLTFFEYSHKPGTYCLMLSDRAMVDVMDTFERCGQYGNGYGWEGVARSAIRAHSPDLAARLKFDPEAGMFVAYGTDSAALKKLGRLLAHAFRDPKELEHLIRTGDPAWFD